MGAAVADTKLITTGSPARVHVPTSDALGGTWRSVSFDDSAWRAGQNGIGYEVEPGAYTASVIADSRGEFSTGGRQGENSWVNGYYNRTADADGVYQASDFQPFPRADGPWDEDNFWDGGSWNWAPDPMPWDTIGATFVHPNGENSGGVEHWVIRRWHSTAGGAITLRFHLRKDNQNGTGVSGKIFKNGTEIFSRAINGSDTTGYEVYVNTTAMVGDVFDFANTPVGLSGDPGDGSDGSVMTATILSGTVTPPPPPVQPTAVADSSTDWVANSQGANGWYYGYYNYTADADHAYDPNSDFNNSDPNWTFQGGAWQLGEAGNPGANPPWDTIGQTDWHPNGDNQPQGAHWVIRRWVSDADGDLHARVQFRKANLGGGNGTTLHVLHNGSEVYAKTVAFNDGVGVDTYVALPGVLLGDKIEFALDPKGTDGLLGDGADGSYLQATIRTGPAPQSALANSVTDWVTGAQGESGWYYGFYNETADADHVYDSNADFNNTDPNWTLQGGSWQLGEPGNPGANPPWDTIGQTDWHPNGDNQPQGVHWVIKRWVSDVDGDVYANVQFGKANTGGGNGVTFRLLRNGSQVFSKTIAFNDGTGINTNVALPGVFIGDKIDFALDPLGTDGSKNDGADGSYIRASILAGLPPVPPKPFVPGVADCFTTDVEAAMKGVNPSIYIRYPFSVTDPASIETLKLKIKYNDGFAAYLNGKEVVKRNAPTAIAGSVVADSIADWSTNPDVTVNGWSYGYYDQTLDSDHTYSGGADLTPFPHDGGGASPTDFWVGNGYDWFAGNPPWTELFQEGTHPNHANGPEDVADVRKHIQWTVRRWTATVDANLKCRVRFRKTNAGCGDGVRVSVFHNSAQVYSQTIAFNDTVGRDDTIDLPDVFLGDTIDVLLGPGDGNDFCDGSAFSAVLFEGEPSIPWNGAATASRTTTETISPEIFDLSAFLTELRAGENVLAIQGFNRTADDNEFVINAELLANRVPTAVNDSVTAYTGVPATFPAAALLANDIDPDSDRLLLVGVTPSYTTSQGGSVRLYGDTVHYASPPAFSGVDTFEYTATDLSGAPRRATVSVQVAPFPVNHPPSFTLAGANIDENTAGPRSVNNWARNISPGPAPYEAGQVVSFLVDNNRGDLFDTGPAIGSAGTLTYAAKRGATGVATVSVRARDNGGIEQGGVDTSAAQTFTITLSVPLVCPTAVAQSVSLMQDASAAITLTANDAAGASYAIASNPVHGTLGGAAPNLTYTPTPGYCGSDSFMFSVSLPGCPNSTATVSITVECANTCPVAEAIVLPPVWKTSSVRHQEYSVALAGANERPNPVNTTGTGSGTLVLHGNELTIHITYSGLTAPVTAAHIHGPATTEQAAGVKLGLIPQFGSPGDTAGSISGTAIITEDLAGWLASGLAYVNIHTTARPGGEIRGQCVLLSQEPDYTVIAPDNITATVTFDGSGSTDADGDTLTYGWADEAGAFGSGVIASRPLAIGQHAVVLSVSDGHCGDTDTILVEVITPGEAVDELIEKVSNSTVNRNKRPLIATLKAAVAAFDRGSATAAVNQLGAFQNKVRAQVAPSDPAGAQECIRMAQAIIDAVSP